MAGRVCGCIYGRILGSRRLRGNQALNTSRLSTCNGGLQSNDCGTGMVP